MKKFLDWTALENEMNILVERMREFHPEILIAAGKEGMVLTALLANKLGIEEVGYVSPKNPQLKGTNKKTVIITDIMDASKLGLNNLREATVKIAALYVKKGIKPRPDFVLDEIE